METVPSRTAGAHLSPIGPAEPGGGVFVEPKSVNWETGREEVVSGG